VRRTRRYRGRRYPVGRELPGDGGRVGPDVRGGGACRGCYAAGLGSGLLQGVRATGVRGRERGRQGAARERGEEGGARRAFGRGVSLPGVYRGGASLRGTAVLGAPAGVGPDHARHPPRNAPARTPRRAHRQDKRPLSWRPARGLGPPLPLRRGLRRWGIFFQQGSQALRGVRRGRQDRGRRGGAGRGGVAAGFGDARPGRHPPQPQARALVRVRRGGRGALVARGSAAGRSPCGRSRRV
ncbi:MAG: Esterase/lipase/thioesterase family active site, partial [uncultured Rubrobacteraceae bacterium]